MKTSKITQGTTPFSTMAMLYGTVWKNEYESQKSL